MSYKETHLVQIQFDFNLFPIFPKKYNKLYGIWVCKLATRNKIRKPL